jgi:hypothetical protein
VIELLSPTSIAQSLSDHLGFLVKVGGNVGTAVLHRERQDMFEYRPAGHR